MRPHLTAILVVSCLWPCIAPAQEEDEFIVIEEVRAEIDDIFESYMASGSGVARLESAKMGVKRLIKLGEDAVPYLIAELEQERLATYDLCAYALGNIGGEEATACLRKTVERADSEPGDAAKSLKKFAIWGLALTGDASALDLVFTGQHRVAAMSVHRNTSIVESAAVLTYPESVDFLLDWMKKLEGDEDRWRERRMIMNALGRIAAPESIPLLTRILTVGAENDRRYAATALRGLDSPKSVAALVSVLDDESYAIRRTSSRALAEIVAPAAREKAVQLLASEEDIFVRGSLYRLVGELGGPNALESLMTWAGQDDMRDRRFLVIAIGQLDDPAILPVLSRSLLDPANSVALEAATQLRRIGSEQALAALTAVLPEMRESVAHSAATLLAEAGYEDAAEPIAARLQGILTSKSSDGESLLAAERLVNALVELGHRPALTMLDRSLEEGLSREMQERIEPQRDRLALIKSNGKKLRRWQETASGEDAELRRFAYRRMGKLGSIAAGRELVAAFDDVDLPTRIAIVESLGDLSAEVAGPLLERVLTGEEFDGLDQLPLRDAAGWSARRIGGAEMLETLVDAVKHVDGGNPRLMVYVAQLDAPRALELFKSVKKPRFRELGSERGDEQLRLDWIERRLEKGRSVDEYDLPPGRLRVR